jgi:hypothetical protein
MIMEGCRRSGLHFRVSAWLRATRADKRTSPLWLRRTINPRPRMGPKRRSRGRRTVKPTKVQSQGSLLRLEAMPASTRTRKTASLRERRASSPPACPPALG